MTVIPTPIRCTGRIGIFDSVVDRIELKRDSKIRQLDIAILGCEDVCSLQVPMYDMHAVQIHQALQDLDDVARHERFWKYAESSQGVLQRAILDVLEDNIDCVLCSDQTFVLDHARMGKAFEQIHFALELCNLFFAFAVNTDTLDSDYASGMYVQSSIDRSKLASADAFAELLDAQVSILAFSKADTLDIRKLWLLYQAP